MKIVGIRIVNYPDDPKPRGIFRLEPNDEIAQCNFENNGTGDDIRPILFVNCVFYDCEIPNYTEIDKVPKEPCGIVRDCYFHKCRIGIGYFMNCIKKETEYAKEASKP